MTYDNTNISSLNQQMLFSDEIEPSSVNSVVISVTKDRKLKKKKINAKNIVLPHSRAKLTLYSTYLEKYLAILSVVPTIRKIHIFDIFCGTGIYNDGRFGSPIIAFNNIKKVDEYLKKSHNSTVKETNLYINDLEEKNVNKVREFIDSQGYTSSLVIKYFNLDAQKMLEGVLNLINSQAYNERNLIFLDPYGYSQIKKETIIKLMQTKKVEIVLFLPASHMHRFKDVVQKEDRRAYESLRNFIYDFFEHDHPIRLNENALEKISIFDFIEHLNCAFSNSGQYYSTSFYLQRDAANYYALFFLTNNILGLERVLDAKWKIDSTNGQGFRLDDSQMSFFKEKEELQELEKNLSKLESIILIEICDKSNLSNCDLYYIALKNNFKPTHATKVLTRLQNQKRIVVSKIDGTKLKKGSFYINNDSFASQKNIINVSIAV